MERQGPGEALQPFLDALGRLFGTTRGREQAVDLVRDLGAHGRRADARGARPRPRRLAAPPDRGRHPRAADPRVRRLHGGGHAALPARLLLEDLQWADPSSVELLCHLGRRSARQRILLALHLPGLGRRGPEPRAAPRHARPARGRARPRARARASRRRGRRAWLDRPLPAERLRRGTRAAPARPRRGAAALRTQPAGAARRTRRDPAARGRLPPRPPDRELDLEPSKDVKDLVRAQLATLPGARARAAGGGERPRQGVLERRRARARRRRRARGGRAPAAPEPRAPRAREPRRGGPAGRHARHPLPLRPRPLPAHPLRGPGRPAPGRAAPPRRASCCCAAGARTPPRAPPRWPSTSSAAATSRAPSACARAPASTRRAASPARRPASTTPARSQLVEQAARRTGRPLEVALLGRRAAAHLLQARFDEAARDYEAMLERARAARLPAAECEALSALCNAHFFEQRLPEMAARAREAVQTAERLGAPHQLAEARGRAALVLFVEGRLDEAARGARRGDPARPRQRRAVRAPDRPWPRAASSTTGAASTPPPRPASPRPSDPVGGARRRLRGLRRAHVPRASSRVNQGRMSEGLADFEQAIVLAAPQRRSLLGAASREPPGLRPPRARRLREARAFDTRALALARENPSPWAPESRRRSSTCASTVSAPGTRRAPPRCSRHSRPAPRAATGCAG